MFLKHSRDCAVVGHYYLKEYKREMQCVVVSFVNSVFPVSSVFLRNVAKFKCILLYSEEALCVTHKEN